MKKQKSTPEDEETIRKETQEDPLEGTKAFGCLLLGIILIGSAIFICNIIITNLR
jgi:hypothetical protein